MDEIINKINFVGERVFYNPTPLIDYEMLIKNSLGSNALFVGFHKINKTEQGSKDVFEYTFNKNKTSIIETINQIKTENELDEYENKICEELLEGLKINIISKQLNSFNKIRKPVDIVFEHLVSMGEDFHEARKNLTRHLFLPLDSQMFQSEFVFSNLEVLHMQIKRTYTFKDIQQKEHYRTIQKFLKEKSEKLGLRCRIFFDLIWNERYNTKGLNLFETNPR